MRMSPALVKLLGGIAAASMAVGQSGALPPNANAIVGAVPALIAVFLSVFGYNHK